MNPIAVPQLLVRAQASTSSPLSRLRHLQLHRDHFVLQAWSICRPTTPTTVRTSWTTSWMQLSNRQPLEPCSHPNAHRLVHLKITRPIHLHLPVRISLAELRLFRGELRCRHVPGMEEKEMDRIFRYHQQVVRTGNLSRDQPPGSDSRHPANEIQFPRAL